MGKNLTSALRTTWRPKVPVPPTTKIEFLGIAESARTIKTERPVENKRNYFCFEGYD